MTEDHKVRCSIHLLGAFFFFSQERVSSFGEEASIARFFIMTDFQFLWMDDLKCFREVNGQKRVNRNHPYYFCLRPVFYPSLVTSFHESRWISPLTVNYPVRGCADAPNRIEKSKERMQRIHDSYAAASVEGEGCESEKVDSLRTAMSGDSGYSSVGIIFLCEDRMLMALSAP